MNKLLFLLLITFMTFNVSAQDVPQSERNALIDFYNSLDGDNWASKTNWKSASNVSTWVGVTVKVINNTPHVTEINLFNNGLFGSIPENINLLSNLEVINLTKAYITNIPSSIGELTTLKSFTLEGVGFSSPLLVLPTTMGNLINLKLLNISNNSLKSLPDSFSALQNLENLNISFNRFTNFPNVITTLINLNTFVCNVNSSMKGILPDSFKNLVNLKILKLQTAMYINNSDIFLQMPNLYELTLDGVDTNGYLNLSNKKYLTYLTLDGPSYTENLKVLNLKDETVKMYYMYVNTRFKCVEVDDVQKAKAGVYPYNYIKQQIRFISPEYANNFSSDCSAYILRTDEINISELKVQNPVENSIYISYPYYINQIEIYTINGQLISSLFGNQRTVSDLAKGIYILKIHTTNGVLTHKIIKR